MKSVARLLAFFLFAAAAQAQQSPTDQINTVRARYKLEFEQISASEKAALAPISLAYVQELTKLKTAAQSKGDLKSVLEFDTLIAAENAGSSAEPAPAGASALRSAFASYQRNKLNALRPLATKRQQLEAGYTRELTALEQQYTRSGQIEAAKLAHDAKATFPNNETETIPNMGSVVLKGDQSVKSEKSFKPPIEVEWRFETDGDVRLGYACEQLIFNWSITPSELRIDGGPVRGQHKKGVGAVPKNKLISVKLVVLPKQMTVSVDGRERASWTGDFSGIDQQIGIRAPSGASVKVDQVIVRKIK